MDVEAMRRRNDELEAMAGALERVAGRVRASRLTGLEIHLQGPDRRRERAGR